MVVYVLNPKDKYGKMFVELCESMTVKEGVTAEDLMKNGFTNFNPPHLYFSRALKNNDKYPVTFAITINKKTLKIKSFDILDECFLQPHFCMRNEYNQVKEILNKLINKNLLSIKK